MNSFAAVAIFSVIAPGLSWAQDIRFETGTSNVQVDALAQQAGQTLRGLTKEDFVVRDEGRVQPILAFEEETTPLDLIVILDTTYGAPSKGSMTATATEALRQMRGQDRTAVISLDGPRMEQEFTSDQTAVAAALERAAHSPPLSMTRALSLWWAGWLFAADAETQSAASAVERKRAILMVTNDASQNWSPDELVIQQLWSRNVGLHLLVVPPHTVLNPLNGLRLDNLDHIARATGGDIVVDTKGTFEKSIPDLLARIRSTYSMWYHVPESKSGELHHITVELNDEAKKKYPNAEIKARQGYIAP
jgi:Ca-activated chloride channel homolog